MESNIERLKRLIKAFADPLKDVDTIYHYTTAEGFKGIIENSEIWLTNTEFVNDLTECKALQKKSDLFEESDFTNRYVRETWKYIQDENRQQECIPQYRNRNKNEYIASFSKKPDSIEQWRAYGNFCIGFEVGKFKKTGFYLFECVYNVEEIRRWILEKGNLPEWELSEPDKRVVLKEGLTTTTQDHEERRGAAHDLLFNASKKLKDKHYENEEEVRLISISNHTWEPYPKSGFSLFRNDPPIYFRVHPVLKVPVPYVKFFISNEGEQEAEQEEGDRTEREVKGKRLEKEMRQKRDLLPIKKVIVGPMVHQKEAEIACEILLGEKGYSVPVVRSEIPYRGF